MRVGRADADAGRRDAGRPGRVFGDVFAEGRRDTADVERDQRRAIAAMGKHQRTGRGGLADAPNAALVARRAVEAGHFDAQRRRGVDRRLADMEARSAGGPAKGCGSQPECCGAQTGSRASKELASVERYVSVRG